MSTKGGNRTIPTFFDRCGGTTPWYRAGHVSFDVGKTQQKADCMAAESGYRYVRSQALCNCVPLPELPQPFRKKDST
jgi:hypothetical protein